MKLSLKIIAEKLEGHVNILKFKDIYSTLRLGRPVFLTDETVLQANTLYIAPSSKLPPDLTYQNGCALIITGTPDTDIIHTPAVIVADEKTDLFAIHNQVSHIFDFFENWQQKLEFISIHYGKLSAFEEFLNASAGVFENILAFSDSSYNYLTAGENYKTSEAADAVGERETEFNKISEDTLAIFRKNPSHRKLISEKDIFLISDPESPYRIMVRNIFQGSKVIYRLSLSDNVRPFRETDYLFLEFLSSYVEKALRRDLDIPVSNANTLTEMFLNAIISGIWQKRAFESELKRFDWSVDDKYAVIYVTSHNQNILLDSSHYYCTEIMNSFSGLLAFSHKGHIIIIVNIRHHSPGNPADIPSDEPDFTELSEFLMSNSLLVGVSNVFDNIYDLQKYHRQAIIAHEIGSEENPELKVHRFTDYVLPYMFRMSTSEFSVEDLLSPIYLRLKKYDEENNSEYLKTLQQYLVQNMNAVQTASALYIHRATLIYRMKRICEIGQTDLKKPDELLHLALSYGLSHNLD